jgi:uncharacterized C2H2 Zn-finger protein
MCRMMKREKTKTLDVFMKELGMEYHCHSCDKNFRTARALDKHIVKKHGDKKPKRGNKRRNA